MSLVGNLEDLGLGDILQIVSLSRKSGVLSLNSRNRDGKIVFRDGQVTRATSSAYQENLGHLLLRKDLVDLPTLKKALAIQKGTAEPPRLGTILEERFGVQRDAIESAVKEQVEKIVYSFFGWTEGTFSFELGDHDPLASISFDPLQFMLDQGLNPQWLAMEGSRIIDEKRHRGEPIEEPPDEPEVDLTQILGEMTGKVPRASAAIDPVRDSVVTPEVPASAKKTLLLIDDDETSRQVLEKTLGRHGFRISCYAGGQDFLRAVAESVQRGESPVALVDLIMPRMDGSGILGGLEILEVLRKEHPGLTTLVLTDHPNQDAENKVKVLGFTTILAKPKKDELRGTGGRDKAIELAGQISTLLVQGGGAPVSRTEPQWHHFGRELLAEMGEQETSDRPVKGPESPGLHLLKGMLQELNNPSLGGGIILLVLRFASEVMNRAIIFLAKEREIVGLGQFGIEIDGEPADKCIRKMRIPRQAGSVFDRAIMERAPVRARLGDNPWDQYLRNQTGGEVPEEVFVGPILSEGHVVALIYGDNLPEQLPIGDTESFEIFLSQAGLAMEKALLERRLKSNAAT